MTLQTVAPSRGARWLQALTGYDGLTGEAPASVRVAEAPLGGARASFITVVPETHNRFPRARLGEVGLEEGWALAQQVRRVMAADEERERRPIVALVDVSSQAYGRREELLGLHLACAAAVDAYASARLAGHPVIALLVGKAMSGAFLAHGYQANRLLALDDSDVIVQAMGKQAAARVTRRSVTELEQLGAQFAPMAYDIRSYASLGLLHEIIEGINADAPSPSDVERVREALTSAIGDARIASRDLTVRWSTPTAGKARAASIQVRQRLREQWDAG
jgi:malonate decarboxylase gamma subunit